MEEGFADADAADEGAVGGAEVAEQVAAFFLDDAAVVAGDGFVGDDQIVVIHRTDADGAFVEDMLAADASEAGDQAAGAHLDRLGMGAVVVHLGRRDVVRELPSWLRR